MILVFSIIKITTLSNIISLSNIKKNPLISMNNGSGPSLTCWITPSPRHLYPLSRTHYLSLSEKNEGRDEEGGTDGENGGIEVVG